MRTFFIAAAVALAGAAHGQQVHTPFVGPSGTRGVGHTGDALRNRCEHTRTCWRYRYDRWTNSHYRVLHEQYYGRPAYNRPIYAQVRRDESREERLNERRDVGREERREERRAERREERRAERREEWREGRRGREDEWERRDEGRERGESCKIDVVRVVGTEHQTETAAKDAAIRQWQATARYDYGERYMDIDNARHMRWRCDRSGTNESVAGRVESAVTAGGGYLRRCIVSAVPCRMPLHRNDKEEPGGVRR